MKDRLVTLFGGLFALYIVIILLSPPTQPDFASYPITTDKGKHGLSFLYRWLDKSKLPVHSLRWRYDELYNLVELPESGNLLVVSLPQKVEARENEREYLRQWLAQGNHILILVAHSDSPEWNAKKSWLTLFRGQKILSELGFNIRFGAEADDDDNDKQEKKLKKEELLQLIADNQSEQTLLKAGKLHTGKQIQNIAVARHPIGASEWRLAAREEYRTTRVILRETEDSSAAAMWHARFGSGAIWISRYADLFSNNWLDEADNAKLFMYIANQALHGEGYILFDDMHQGISDIYDADAFFSDSRLHNTLWFVFGFWLLYLVGRTNRLAPPLKEKLQAHAVDFVRAVGGLFARRLSNPTTALGLMRHFFNDVRKQFGMPLNGKPVWDILSASPRLQNEKLGLLQQSYRMAQQDHKQNLIELHNLLRETRNCLS